MSTNLSRDNYESANCMIKDFNIFFTQITDIDYVKNTDKDHENELN